MDILTLLTTLQKYQWETRDEKLLQEELFKIFLKESGFIREYRIDSKNIIDFFHPESGIALECKTQGTSMNIYRQLKRYAQFPQVKEILLVSSKPMSLPALIEEKPTSVYLLGRNWL